MTLPQTSWNCQHKVTNVTVTIFDYFPFFIKFSFSDIPFQSEEESIEIIEDVPKSSPEPEIINSDDGNEPANDESSAIDTGSAEISRPNRAENADTQENAETISAEETSAENATQATNDDDDSDELDIPDGPETQVQSAVVDSGMESAIYNYVTIT